MVTLLVTALAASFALSLIDYWIDLRYLRGPIAALLSAGFALLYEPGCPLLPVSLAAGFLAVSLIRIIERATQVQVRVRR